MGVSRAEKFAFKLLGHGYGEFVSKRDGFVIVKMRENDATSIVWIRQNPITREALEFFKKVISKYEYDKLVLIKLYREADYVKYSDLKLFDEIRYA